RRGIGSPLSVPRRPGGPYAAPSSRGPRPSARRVTATSRVPAQRPSRHLLTLVLALHALDVPSHGLLCDLPGTDPLPGQFRLDLLQTGPEVIEAGPFRDLTPPDRPVQFVLQLLHDQL